MKKIVFFEAVVVISILVFAFSANAQMLNVYNGTTRTSVVPPAFNQNQVQTSSSQFITRCAVNSTEVRAGEQVVFAGAHAGGVEPISYHWTEAVSGIGQTRSTSFASPGIKTAHLFAQDARGAIARASCSVAVSSALAVSNTSSAPVVATAMEGEPKIESKALPLTLAPLEQIEENNESFSRLFLASLIPADIEENPIIGLHLALLTIILLAVVGYLLFMHRIKKYRFN